MSRRLMAMLMVVLFAGCGRDVTPIDVDAVHSQCAFCRMAVSTPRVAAQIVAPGAEPLFFDDIGCLRDYLMQPTAPVTSDAVAFVADHRTGEWARAARATYTRTGLGTPMGSGLIAHASEGSRDVDPSAAGGSTVAAHVLFGAGGPPDGGAR